MTLTIQLSSTEEAQLAAAARQHNLEPAEFARRLVTEHLPPVAPDEAQDPTLALFAQWQHEDARMTPDEAAQERRLWEAFENGINETRHALGMRPL